MTPPPPDRSRIERMRWWHIPQVAALEAQLFAVDSPWGRAQFWAELAAGHRYRVAVDDDGRVVGYAGLAVGPEQAGIQTIGVEPGRRGRGLGRRLLTDMLTAATGLPVILEVRSDNVPAIALYASAGFIRIGRRRRYYHPSGADADVMRRPPRPGPPDPADPHPSRSASAGGHGILGIVTAPTAAAAPAPIRLPAGSIVMGVETSCDETGVGLVRITAGAPELLGQALASSADQHARFGGVVPEIASRAHLEALIPTVHRALAAADLTADRVDAVAVTAGPGLAGSLMVGVAAAKAYAAAWQVPLFGVNHLAGHVAADTLDHGPLPTPALALLVSGGHTQLLRVNSLAGDGPAPIVELGSTIDDAAGEAYDKVARLLELGYPGGPVIDRLAADGDPHAFVFPRGLTGARDRSAHRFHFSFSGLKTAVARQVERLRRDGVPVPVADICASFQEAVADVLTAKMVDAALHEGLGTIVMAGGVAANGRLRALATERCREAGLELRIPRIDLCTDNGAMIAAVGAHIAAAGAVPSPADLGADPALPVHTVVVSHPG